MIDKILSMCFAFSFLFSSNAPYSLDKFKDILGIAKLQAPTSIYNPMYSRKYGDFIGYSNKYFYLDKDNMVFYMCKNHHRSELRFKHIWKTNTKTEKYIEAEVKLLPLNIKKEFTFLQIHADDNIDYAPVINKPLLRIAYRKNYHAKKGHIWAIVKMNSDPYIKYYKKIDLGKMPNKFFKVKIIVKNNYLKIFVNNVQQIVIDVSFWDKFYNYFKAGVYLQSDGCAKVLFNKLKIKD